MRDTTGPPAWSTAGRGGYKEGGRKLSGSWKVHAVRDVAVSPLGYSQQSHIPREFPYNGQALPIPSRPPPRFHAFRTCTRHRTRRMRDTSSRAVRRAEKGMPSGVAFCSRHRSDQSPKSWKGDKAGDDLEEVQPEHCLEQRNACGITADATHTVQNPRHQSNSMTV